MTPQGTGLWSEGVTCKWKACACCNSRKPSPACVLLYKTQEPSWARPSLEPGGRDPGLGQRVASASHVYSTRNETHFQVLKEHSSHRSMDVLLQNTRTDGDTWKLDARGGTPAGFDGESLSHPPTFRGTCNLTPLS